jgi:hypothetical protein
VLLVCRSLRNEKLPAVLRFLRGAILSEEKKMKGLYAGQPQRETATPTAVAMLEAISREEITLTEIEFDGKTTWHLTPLPELLVDALRYLHLPVTLYTGLGVKPAIENSVFDISIFGK